MLEVMELLFEEGVEYMLVVIDICGLCYINDKLGLCIGDDCLKVVV